MTRAGRLLAVPLSAVLLAGCAADPADDRRAQVAAVTEAANAGDADRLREEADRLIAMVADSADLPDDRADRLRALAASVRTGADVIDAELLEQRRREAEAEAAAAAERQRLEEERQRLEAEREQLEADRAKAEQDRKGKGKKDDDEDDDD